MYFYFFTKVYNTVLILSSHGSTDYKPKNQTEDRKNATEDIEMLSLKVDTFLRATSTVEGMLNEYNLEKSLNSKFDAVKTRTQATKKTFDGTGGLVNISTADLSQVIPKSEAGEKIVSTFNSTNSADSMNLVSAGQINRSASASAVNVIKTGSDLDALFGDFHSTYSIVPALEDNIVLKENSEDFSRFRISHRKGIFRPSGFNRKYIIIYCNDNYVTTHLS